MDGVKSRGLVFNLISALLLGSSLSLIFTKLLITMFNLSFVSLSMPGMSEGLAYDKTFDLLDFGLAGGLSLVIFLGNYFGARIVSKVFKRSDFSLANILILVFGTATFLQSHFLVFSNTQVLGMIFIFELIYFGVGVLGSKFSFDNLRESYSAVSLQNGIFLGFLFLLITNNLTTIPFLSLSFLILTPLLFSTLKVKGLNDLIKNLPGFLVVVAIIFPNNLVFLSGLLGAILISGFLVSKFKSGFFSNNFFSRILNPALIIFLVVFNPGFYIGNFDSVEEGFWLSWVQRLSEGQVLYKDVLVYHSPFIPWGMYWFSKVAGLSIYSERLFLHLLQVLGIIIYFFFSRKVLKNTLFAILSTFVFMAVTSTLVRNNVEIRVGLPLLSLIFLFNFFELRKKWMLFVSAIISGAALFLSLEGGIAVFIASLFGIFISSDKKLPISLFKNIGIYVGGVFVTSGLVLGYLFITGSLAGFIEQSLFYAKAFSQGYFNSAMERSVTHAYFHFDVLDEYLDSVTIFWEITKLTFVGFLIYWVYKLIKKSNLESTEIQIFTTAFFGLILTRAALGRSDFYHLLFVLGIALVLIFYALLKLFSINKLLSLGLILFVIFILARVHINNSFLEKNIFKYQTYGKVTGEYKSYDFERGGALVGMEIDEDSTSNLVKYIQDNSSQEDTIFVYPWNPELYFYADRKGATRVDTPYAFFDEKYQNLIIEDLKNNPPKFLIYNGSMNFGNLTVDTLPLVNKFINENYEKVEGFGNFDVMSLGNDLEGAVQ